ncbi:RNase3 domain-containing protein [Xylaria sp. FL1042]|nr:RNase3 domain-containing protein [Xylaria sp. FL1042]
MHRNIHHARSFVTQDESTSDEEDSGSLEPTTPFEALPNQVSGSHYGTRVTPVCTETSNQENAPMAPIDEKTVIHARAYQIEMFEKSLERNIIVAMDTGSGKTQVAVLRIQAELEKGLDKLVWFLAPTVALCEQQFQVLKSQIGAAQIKILSSADNVDTWSDTRIWDDYLRNVRVVVSTYQVLLDAITHAFVRMSQLCLIVFDEAHNCTGKHAGSKIMERYRICKNKGMPCPAILGLTASPIMKSSLDGIGKIEQTLDAVCKGPTLHREELLSAVKRPTLSSIVVPNSGIRPDVASVTSFAKVFRDLDIFQDPYVLRLRRQNNEKSLYRLQKALGQEDTPIMKQMKSTYRKSTEIHRELGPWASEYFIYEAITRFLQSVTQDLTWFETWDTTDKQYLANVLRQVEIKFPQPFSNATPLDLSDKFITLVRELQSVPEGTRCIIFVLETATVAVLAHMLSNTASISDRFRVGTMIGTSNYMGRKRDLGDLNQVKNTLALEEFRAGKLNLLVATSVAEEGIDVPACNLVICFNAPPNVKSFIQRRGRARMESSRIILLSDGSSDQHNTWIALEKAMKQCYEDDMRVIGKLAELEELDASPDIAPLRISSTGAQLDFDQARSHLEYFCQKITSGQYIEHRPYYIPEHVGISHNGIQMLSATVNLPPSLPKALRRVKGLRRWYSERNAFKDAAFQAFKALYEAGLVNDNLMPLVDDILEGVEARSSMVEVNGIWNPWQKVAQLWGESNERIQRELFLKDGNRVIAKFEASLPCYFPKIPPFNIYWDAKNTWTVELSEYFNLVAEDSLKEDQSAALMDLAFGHRWALENSAHILHLQSTETIPFREHIGQRAVEKDVLNSESVVRSKSGEPLLFIEWLPCEPPPELVSRTNRDASDEPEDGPYLALRKWPRRQDLLHPVHPAHCPSKPGGRYHRALPVSDCTLVDRSKVCFGSIIPWIIHVFEVHLIAEELCNTVLKGVGFSNISLVVTAISSPAAGWLTNYERCEFLGDSLLKLLATVSVMIQQPNYPEGYLSAMKDRIVSNSRLCRASIEKGIDRFIFTEIFTGRKWRPLYIKSLLSAGETHPATRRMSTKTLADVVESLIGAAYIDGSIPKAMACVRTFLPEVEWYDLTCAHTILSGRRDVIAQSHPGHQRLAELVGYTFQNKALLSESLTHASWNLDTSEDVCMERLEFLGDPILDNIIVSILWTHEPELSHSQMHLLRTACVNADLLGFLAMGWCTMQEATEVCATTLTTIVTKKSVPFWKYMRHGSSEIASAQQNMEQRYTSEREAILDVIAHGTEYPWAQLAHLTIPKFYSDMVESLIGAIWIDSGSMEQCKEVVERIGILPYLRRMLSDNVDVRHPKNRLGELVGRDGSTVRYETEVRAQEGAKDLLCRVFVNNQVIVEVKGGVKSEEVMAKAADEAYHMLLRRADDSDDEMIN